MGAQSTVRFLVQSSPDDVRPSLALARHLFFRRNSITSTATSPKVLRSRRAAARLRFSVRGSMRSQIFPDPARLVLGGVGPVGDGRVARNARHIPNPSKPASDSDSRVNRARQTASIMDGRPHSRKGRALGASSSQPTGLTREATRRALSRVRGLVAFGAGRGIASPKVGHFLP